MFDLDTVSWGYAGANFEYRKGRARHGCVSQEAAPLEQEGQLARQIIGPDGTTTIQSPVRGHSEGCLDDDSASQRCDRLANWGPWRQG